MKTHKSTSTNKLVARFDNQLKKLLVSEIKTIRGVNAHMLSNAQAQARLTA